VEVPESQLNNVAFETTGSTTTVTTEATVTEMEITVEKNVVVEGENLSKPTFTLNSNGKSTLTLANQKTVGAIIAAEGAKNQINFAGGAAKSTQVNGDAGKEVIKIADDTKLTGKSVMNLGANKDKVIIDGIINKLTIDNGNDTAKDKVEISSLDNIQKRLKVKNFGEEDRLIIEGDAFRYQDLEDKDLREPLKDLGIIVTLAEIN
jgi:hypothetical protein